MCEEEMEKIKCDDEMDESEKNKILQSKRTKSIGDVLEEVGARSPIRFISAHFSCVSLASPSAPKTKQTRHAACSVFALGWGQGVPRRHNHIYF